MHKSVRFNTESKQLEYALPLAMVYMIKRENFYSKDEVEKVIANHEAYGMLILTRLRALSKDYDLVSVEFTDQALSSHYTITSDLGEKDYVYVNSLRFECLVNFAADDEISKYLTFTPRSFND